MRKVKPRPTGVMPGGHRDTSTQRITKGVRCFSLCRRASMVPSFQNFDRL